LTHPLLGLFCILESKGEATSPHAVVLDIVRRLNCTVIVSSVDWGMNMILIIFSCNVSSLHVSIPQIPSKPTRSKKHLPLTRPNPHKVITHSYPSKS
jgi:hypothetical protein